MTATAEPVRIALWSGPRHRSPAMIPTLRAPAATARLDAPLCPPPPSTHRAAPPLQCRLGVARFGAAAGQLPSFGTDFIAVTGKSMADVSCASASSTGSGTCPDITAFKVNGLDANALQGFYTQLQTSDGTAPTPASVGAKRVIQTHAGNYAYFKGYTVFVVDASRDGLARGEALPRLP